MTWSVARVEKAIQMPHTSLYKTEQGWHPDGVAATLWSEHKFRLGSVVYDSSGHGPAAYHLLGLIGGNVVDLKYESVCVQHVPIHMFCLCSTSCLIDGTIDIGVGNAQCRRCGRDCG